MQNQTGNLFKSLENLKKSYLAKPAKPQTLGACLDAILQERSISRADLADSMSNECCTWQESHIAELIDGSRWFSPSIQWHLSVYANAVWYETIKRYEAAQQEK